MVPLLFKVLHPPTWGGGGIERKGRKEGGRKGEGEIGRKGWRDGEKKAGKE